MIAPLQQEWPAAYFDGANARRHDVKVRITPGRLSIIQDDGGELLWPYEEIRQTQGHYAGEQVRLERGNPIAETLVVSNQDFLLAMRQMAPNLGQEFHDPRLRSRRWKLTAAAAVGVVVLGSAMYFWGVPAIANALAALLPVSWEERLGKSAMGMLVSLDDKCENPAGLAALDSLVQKLADGIEDSPYTFRVTIARGEMVNAFAAPGGYVVVFQGLLKQSETPDQLAGVLAHEMQHVVHRHSTRALFQEISAQALLSILSGDTSATPFGIDSAALLADMHHQRSHEDEADRDGMQLMRNVKADPRGMIEMFNHLNDLGIELPTAIQYLSSHPATDDRIAVLEQLAEGADYEPEPLLSEQGWADLQGACKMEED